MNLRVSILFILLLFGCDKAEVEKQEIQEVAFCKLTSSYQSITTTVKYGYSNDAKINKVTYIFTNILGRDGETDSTVYNLSRNANGQLVSAEYSGSDGTGKETYEYENGLISKVNWQSQDRSEQSNISYNSQGLIARFTYESANQGVYRFDTFEYDSNGLLVETVRHDSDGKPLIADVVKPTVIHKSPETIVINAGLTYDLRSGRPLRTVVGGEGTIEETYFQNFDTSALELDSEEKVYDTQVDENGYLISHKVDVENSFTSYTNTFINTLQDCGNAN